VPEKVVLLAASLLQAAEQTRYLALLWYRNWQCLESQCQPELVPSHLPRVYRRSLPGKVPGLRSGSKWSAMS
jgi:hypothetical protein